MRAAANSTWNARLEMRARAEDVLDALTDPEVCSRWSPIDFELEELDGDRLVTGSRARVAGRLAGARMGFDVEIHKAGLEGLALSVSGPLVLDVDYRLDEEPTSQAAPLTVVDEEPGTAPPVVERASACA